MSVDRELTAAARAWPFEEARKLLARLGGEAPAKGHVLFETGYGPSGLPHIGTFGEVVRTTMVRHAFQQLSDLPTRLFAFSDDMDGLRKVPENVPNQGMMGDYLGVPLTRIPDPFGEDESYGHHNNRRLRVFLDQFGFDYEFQSASDWYRSGRFDPALLTVLRHFEEVIAVVLPELGADRRQTYCPFLPVVERNGHPRVLHLPAAEVKAEAGTIVFRDEDGTLIEVPVTGGHCKLQWRVDWAMRWFHFGVDYEMSGKDLIDSVRLGGRICRILGGRPPEGFTYELFLDADGRKISKSLGNGLTVEEWLRYAPPESLSLFMFQSPKSAKRLHFDVIPRQVDDYLTWLAKYPGQEARQRLENPVWHIHSGAPPTAAEEGLTFNVLLNLAGVANTEDKAVLWGFISRYAPAASPAANPILDRLVGHAIAFYQDFVKPRKRYRPPTPAERAALEDLAATLLALPVGTDAETIQTQVYEVGKRHPFPDLKAWFQSLYEVLFGQSQGPRMGSFIALYGVGETAELIRRAIAGAPLAAE